MTKNYRQRVDNSAAIRSHTAAVEELLQQGVWSESSCESHSREIEFLQNERIAHLYTLIGTMITAILALILCTISPSIGTIVLFLLFIGLTIPYVVHYVFLENTIQYWYELDRKLRSRQ